MQLGMVGLGRMGANMVRRLMKAGHECVVYDVFPKSVEELVKVIQWGLSAAPKISSPTLNSLTSWPTASTVPEKSTPSRVTLGVPIPVCMRITYGLPRM